MATKALALIRPSSTLAIFPLLLQLPLRVVDGPLHELVELYEPVAVLVLVLPEPLLHRVSHACEVHLHLVLVEPPVAVQVDLLEEGQERGPRREPVLGAVLRRLRFRAAPRRLGGAPPIERGGGEGHRQRRSQPPSHFASKYQS
ncbi:hypothetical protein THAOC_01660 [Thalassiosira oceanica]|uniref:Secreted protein n=1 Tax=Thalassiosira oceanica TaxID=159749 RepID=K0TMW2_THAOC|nr:hypothetical protein THAOC_01660 [Thalassiosira oceanica]|eukprot:EJK76571.1 hypothetical protein THAOC_01660 [Thalassiosira oceanica]